MRCCFHITDGEQVIRDVKGIEIPDVEATEPAALVAIKEVQREDAYTAEDWRGWWVEAIAV